MRAVMVGCGAMSNGWLTAIRDEPALRGRVEMAGFCDLDPAAAARQAAAYGFEGAATGSDLAAMLETVRPDVVFDLVVPAARRGVVEAALGAGAHVLSEKPMANSLAEATALLDAAARAGRVHAVVQNRRHLRGIRRARALIASGALGEITAIHADFFMAPRFGGFREAMDHVLLHDMAIHTFDAARFLWPSEPVGVFAQETNPTGSWFAHGAAANALFDGADGSAFTYRGSWVAPGAETGWESAWRIVGSEGSVLWDGNDAFRAEVAVPGDAFLRPVRPLDVPDVDPLPAEGHAGVILDFLDALETGRAPLSAAPDNVRSVAMVFGAIRSAETGQRVALDPHLGETA